MENKDRGINYEDIDVYETMENSHVLFTPNNVVVENYDTREKKTFSLAEFVTAVEKAIGRVYDEQAREIHL